MLDFSSKRNFNTFEQRINFLLLCCLVFIHRPALLHKLAEMLFKLQDDMKQHMRFLILVCFLILAFELFILSIFNFIHAERREQNLLFT